MAQNVLRDMKYLYVMTIVISDIFYCNIIVKTTRTLDHCKLEQCYLKLKKRENEIEASNSQLLDSPSNITEDVNIEKLGARPLGDLELISKTCRMAELKCSVCNDFDDCKHQPNELNHQHFGKRL